LVNGYGVCLKGRDPCTLDPWPSELKIRRVHVHTRKCQRVKQCCIINISKYFKWILFYIFKNVTTVTLTFDLVNRTLMEVMSSQVRQISMWNVHSYRDNERTLLFYNNELVILTFDLLNTPKGFMIMPRPISMWNMKFL